MAVGVLMLVDVIVILNMICVKCPYNRNMHWNWAGHRNWVRHWVWHRPWHRDDVRPNVMMVNWL